MSEIIRQKKFIATSLYTNVSDIRMALVRAVQAWERFILRDVAKFSKYAKVMCLILWMRQGKNIVTSDK